MSVRSIKSSPSLCVNSSPYTGYVSFFTFHSVCIAARGRPWDQRLALTSESGFTGALLSFNSYQSLDLFFVVTVLTHVLSGTSLVACPDHLPPQPPSLTPSPSWWTVMAGRLTVSMHERASSFSFCTQTMLHSSFCLPIGLCRLSLSLFLSLLFQILWAHPLFCVSIINISTWLQWLKVKME